MNNCINKPEYLYALLQEQANKLPIEDVREIAELIQYDEWGVAYEMLCTQLFDYEIPITSEYYDKMEKIAKLMEIESIYWLPLKKLIKDDKIPEYLYALLNEKTNMLPTEDVQFISELIDHDESQVAFEGLCEEIDEYRIPIDADYYMRLERMGKSMEIDPSCWQSLKKLVYSKNKMNVMVQASPPPEKDDLANTEKTSEITKQNGVDEKNKATEYINLASEKRTKHILYGDKSGGGHLYPGGKGLEKMNNSSKITEYLYTVLYEKADMLPTEDVRAIAEYIDYDEWGIAYEMLCTQLYDYDIPINSEYYDKMEKIGKLMEIEPRRWLPLKKLIIE